MKKISLDLAHVFVLPEKGLDLAVPLEAQLSSTPWAALQTSSIPWMIRLTTSIPWMNRLTFAPPWGDHLICSIPWMG